LDDLNTSEEWERASLCMRIKQDAITDSLNHKICHKRMSEPNCGAVGKMNWKTQGDLTFRELLDKFTNKDFQKPTFHQ